MGMFTDIKIGYLVIAVLYFILASAKTDYFYKVDFWVYLGVGAMYLLMSEAISIGIKLD